MILAGVPIGREKCILSAEELTHSRINSTFPGAKDNNKSKGQTFFSPFLPSHCCSLTFHCFFCTLCWYVAVAFGQVNAVLVSLCLHSLFQACVSASRIYSSLQLLALSVPHQIFPSLSMHSPDPSQSQLGLLLPWPFVLSSLWECLMSTSGPATSCASSSQLQPASSACLLLT